MAEPFGVDIDSLCADLGVELPEPAAPPGQGGGDSTPGGGTSGDGAIARPRWTPLVLLEPPGLDTLLSTIKPPLEIIKALLQVISALLKVLAAILIGLLDPYRALILAAYQALKSLLEDLLNAGGYLYYDIPGITSFEAFAAEMGLPHETPAQIWKHGQKGEPPPPVPVDGFDKWAHRFAESFDDPGDLQRPVFSTGATVGAVFIVAGAPSLAPLAQLFYQIGKLLNIQPFVDAFKHFEDTKDSPDPDLSRARQHSVAPDWHSLRVQDLLPPLRKLLAIPELLKTILLQLDGLQSLLADMAAALAAKAAILDDIVNTLQAILDFLDALKSSGLYMLPVFTTEGVEGLKRRFIEAENRPPGGYVAGLCLLAAGPGIPGMTVIYDLVSSPDARQAAVDSMTAAWEKNKDTAGQAWKDSGVENAWNGTQDTAEKAALDLRQAAQAAVRDTGDPTGIGRTIDAIAASGPMKSIESFAAGVEGEVDEAVKRARGWTEQSKKKAPRSLAAAYGPRRGKGKGKP